MTHIDPSAAAARENARQTTGQFGTQDHTAPGDLLTYPTLPEDTTYGVYRDGTLIGLGEKGAGMNDALHRAEVAMNYNRYDNDAPKPVWTIRSEGSDIEIAVPYGDQGRIVGWYMGDAITGEEMDERNVSLTQFDSVAVEPYIDLGQHNEGDLPTIEQWARDGGFYLSNIYAHRDEETGGRHVDVGLNENFLWNADVQCPDDEYDDESDLDEDDDREASVQRYERWLNEHEDVVKEVYLEWFNADLDVPDTWETATVTMRLTTPYERFTESLVMEDLYPLLAAHTNRTDPGCAADLYRYLRNARDRDPHLDGPYMARRLLLAPDVRAWRWALSNLARSDLQRALRLENVGEDAFARTCVVGSGGSVVDGQHV